MYNRPPRRRDSKVSHTLLYGGAHKTQSMKRSNNADNYREHKTTNDFVYYDPHVYINSESD